MSSPGCRVAPSSEIAAVAANVDHRVDGAAATEHFAASNINGATVEAGLWRCCVTPVLSALWIPQAEHRIHAPVVDSGIGVHATHLK